MIYSFTAHGHPNIRGTHRSTLEFTKDATLTESGDCIIGVNAAFELSKLRQLLNYLKVAITIEAAGITETITAVPNKAFGSIHELVIRVGEFSSERTFATRADKSAAMLNRDLIKALQKGATATVTIFTI
jgi:uncharacterized protein